ncbi:MKI67 FHA domain-interacting nucleolar phosphoprotein isoform X2 [Stegostoma tigrinum]|uniref:MKI67 FHA domain-interacting nucleolar phosphoprotein isoform X2 n=1 Tax=Stegostoma tigrinum TaxID=3053191 RepID=UPI00202BA1AF|nr:MKI67 FHA domain-interacting nucleolar phosphoprotein isoform X2 [Stegostoma tigrinum]
MAESKSGPGSRAQQLMSLDPKKQKEFQRKLHGMKKQKKVEKLTPGVIYLGHIPKGFFEPAIKKYFSQFGTVLRVRLSRSKKTGNSKGYAFVEFECEEVAKIVAETMNNYLFNERLLKCQILPPEKVHPQLFKGSHTTFKKPTFPSVTRYNKKRTPKQESVMSKRLLAKEGRLRKRLAEKGIDYDFPGFAAVLPQTKKQTCAEMNDTVNSQDVTPVCTPTVLKRRQSLKTIDDTDDEVTFKILQCMQGQVLKEENLTGLEQLVSFG